MPKSGVVNFLKTKGNKISPEASRRALNSDDQTTAEPLRRLSSILNSVKVLNGAGMS